MIYKRIFKRPLDFILALFALIFLSPLLLILALLVKQRLGKPLLFKQQRPGLNEKLFTLYKFRTMTDQRDGAGNLLPSNLRTTAFGNLLRKTSLDELPELVNIVKGEMSLIGPRPLLAEYLPYYTEEEKKRHTMRPGLTGLAQVNGRNFLSWEERFKLDNNYIKNCNFILDCKILWKTLTQVIKGKDVADVTKRKTDEKGTFTQHQGKVFRRLDVERKDKLSFKN